MLTHSAGQCIRVQITWPLPIACEDVSDLILVLGWVALVSSSSCDISKPALNTATGHTCPALFRAPEDQLVNCAGKEPYARMSQSTTECRQMQPAEETGPRRG